MKVLVAEAETDLNNMIVTGLKKEGYSADGVFTGTQAEKHLKSSEYDIILMDIMMPDKNGIELTRLLRERGNSTPILLITALDDIENRVKALNAGADDYLIKPFGLGEVFARIRFLTKQSTNTVENRLQVGDLTLNPTTHNVSRGQIQIKLSVKEFSILYFMMKNAGKPLTREQIKTSSWDFSFDGKSNIIDVYIRYLRKKIDAGFGSKLIHTVRGVGYIIEERL